MKRIILASGSVQRKKLLKQLGLDFTIQPSQAEESNQITSSCAALVKKNALLKAKDVADKNTEGIVIGADTVVYAGNRLLIGKPKDLNDAEKILKILFSKPQWVYTGVAVIDVKSKKTMVDFEKTKVYMTRLTSKEIASYHQKVNPLDKAGGFDIEGWGSAFIYRIEGCYTNVIGLPMPKMASMLKKFGVSILSLILCVLISACSSEFNLATNKQETLMYTTEREVNLGDKVAASVEKQFEFVEDIDVNARVERLLNRIVEVCDRKDILYYIKVIDEDKMNAVSLPGGYVYIFKGLYDKMENDDELAGVIAHEVGHITARHGVKRMQAAYSALLVQVVAMEAGGGAEANLALNSLFSEYSKQDEFEADQLSVKYLKKAGFDPLKMINVLKVLQEEHDKEPLRKYSYWRTHPHIAKRIGVVYEAATGKMRFKDYLNLTGEY